MSETKEDIKKNKILNAVAHVVWMLIISVAIIFLFNELFRGSNIGKVVILIVIATYIIFSFARKFWIEKRTKKILDAIDITWTLVGSFFLIMIAQGYKYSSKTDNVGHAARSLMNGMESQPHFIVFYIGILLLVIGVIRIYIINKQQYKPSK
ncbi:MAG: hypothetical protein ACP5OA_06740 [Candidatus Woesearchaeota archaeon]